MKVVVSKDAEFKMNDANISPKIVKIYKRSILKNQKYLTRIFNSCFYLIKKMLLKCSKMR